MNSSLATKPRRVKSVNPKLTQQPPDRLYHPLLLDPHLHLMTSPSVPQRGPIPITQQMERRSLGVPSTIAVTSREDRPLGLDVIRSGVLQRLPLAKHFAPRDPHRINDPR